MQKYYVLIIVFYCLFSVFPLFSDDDNLKADDLIYLTEEYPPFNYIEDGQLHGISVEVLKLIWNEMNIVEQEIKVFPWSRAYRDTQIIKNYVLFTTLRTEEREDLFNWVGPIYLINNILFTLTENPIEIISLEDAKDYTIGTTLKDASYDLLISSGFDQNKLESVKTLEQNIRKLMLGRIDLISHTNISLQYFLKSSEYKSLSLKKVYVFKETGGYFAFNKDIPDSLIEEFQQALESIEREHQMILNKYLGENSLE